MGILIEKYKPGTTYKGRAHAADGFTTDTTGHLIPLEGEVFETLPLGSLNLIAFVSLGSSYQRNPDTTDDMLWEIGFSDRRVSFFSPNCAKQSNSSSRKAGNVTLGFYYYNELRSLSLGSIASEGGPYVSMVFVIKLNWFSQIPLGVRVHGAPEVLRVFALMLGSRLIKSYDLVCSSLGVDARELGDFFEEINTFNFSTGRQTDLFINAQGNTVRVTSKLV